MPERIESVEYEIPAGRFNGGLAYIDAGNALGDGGGVYRKSTRVGKTVGL